MNEWDIHDPRTLVCELCDRKVQGRISKRLWGGGLMVCEPCFLLLEEKQNQPYSQVMEKFALRACGYHINRKLARMGDAGDPFTCAQRRRRELGYEG